MSKLFHFGIIGLGGIARKWADDVNKYLPEAQISTVCSRNEAHARAFAQEFGAKHACSSIAELLALDGIDAVYIANPHVDHFEAAMACLQAQIPVICEKPMALHLWQVEALVQIAQERKVFLMEAIWSRFIPGFAQALDLVQEGQIGEIQTITADFGFRADPLGKARIWQKELGAGSLLDIGIYPILLTQYLLGQPDEILSSAIITETGIDADCAMIFKWKGDKQALLHSSILTNTPTEALIHGTLGTLHLHTRFHHPSQITLTLAHGQSTSFHTPYDGHGYHFEARAAMEAIRAGAIEHASISHAFSLNLAQTLHRVLAQIGVDYTA
jgi:predicted dehydrogenase